jgi:hypothetical protein
VNFGHREGHRFEFQSSGEWKSLKLRNEVERTCQSQQQLKPLTPGYRSRTRATSLSHRPPRHAMRTALWPPDAAVVAPPPPMWVAPYPHAALAWEACTTLLSLAPQLRVAMEHRALLCHAAASRASAPATVGRAAPRRPPQAPPELGPPPRTIGCRSEPTMSHYAPLLLPLRSPLHGPPRPVILWPHRHHYKLCPCTVTLTNLSIVGGACSYSPSLAPPLPRPYTAVVPHLWWAILSVSPQESSIPRAPYSRPPLSPAWPPASLPLPWDLPPLLFEWASSPSCWASSKRAGQWWPIWTVRLGFLQFI